MKNDKCQIDFVHEAGGELGKQLNFIDTVLVSIWIEWLKRCLPTNHCAVTVAIFLKKKKKQRKNDLFESRTNMRI